MGLLQCTPWLLPLGLFLALSLSRSESKGLTLVGCFSQTGGWEALMGEWRAG